MPGAARIQDITTHAGTVTGPGCPTVLIGGMPAAVAGDLHTCALPVTPPHPPTPFPMGSITVFIGGKPALRAGDASGCGATILIGCTTVNIG